MSVSKWPRIKGSGKLEANASRMRRATMLQSEVDTLAGSTYIPEEGAARAALEKRIDEIINSPEGIPKVKVHPGGGQKHASGKLPYHLITKEMLDALAEALQLGLEKGYPSRNWERGLPIDEASLSSAISHIFKYKSGLDYNIEKKLDGSGKCKKVHHLCCAMVNIGMAITQIKRGRTDLDDRGIK